MPTAIQIQQILRRLTIASAYIEAENGCSRSTVYRFLPIGGRSGSLSGFADRMTQGNRLTDVVLHDSPCARQIAVRREFPEIENV
jgi:hypothetical protein